MKRKVLHFLPPILFILSGTASAEEQCVQIAGQNLEPSQIYSSKHQCGTCPGQQASPTTCGATNRLMVPYWSKPADVVSIPHRGFWGQPLSGGASENTLAALEQAAAQGYHVIEIDVTFTGPKPDGSGPDVFLGHYFSMASVGGSASQQPADYPPAQLTQFKMNKRSMTPSHDAKDSLLLFNDALTFAHDKNVLLMVDPKEPANAPDDYLEQVIAKVLQITADRGMFNRIAIKTSRPYAEMRARLDNLTGGKIAQWEGHFLWSPITATTAQSRTLDEIITFIDDWHAHTESSKQVATYEVSLFSPDYFGAKPFTRGGKTYKNLVDYVRQLTPLGKRSAFWSVDPMGDKGTFSRTYTWKFIGNTVDDKRGNPLTNLSYDYGPYVAINTDRPDQYDSFVSQPYSRILEPVAAGMEP